MLVHKVKSTQGKIKGVWDFPKGGVEARDINLEQALLRELREETGSSKYVIIKRYNENVCFNFDSFTSEKIGFKSQETTMFLVQYQGDETDLKPEDDEIDDIQFFSEEKVPELLFPESKEFFEKYFK